MGQQRRTQDQRNFRLMSTKKRYYRFGSGTFIKAKSFEDAKKKYIKQIENETESTSSWHNCTCLGLSHRTDCPENPANRGEIPY